MSGARGGLLSVGNRVEAVQRSPRRHPAVAANSSQTKVSAGTSPPPLCIVISGEKEGRTPSRLLFCNQADWTDILLLSCLGTSSKLHSWWCLCNVFFHLLQSCLASASSWERGHPTAATPGAHDSLSVARLDDLPQQGVL